MKLIADASNDDEGTLLLAAKAQILKTNKTKTNPALKPFTFAVSPKKVKIPGFTWKAGEGKERLEQVREELYRLTEAVEKTILEL